MQHRSKGGLQRLSGYCQMLEESLHAPSPCPVTRVTSEPWGEGPSPQLLPPALAVPLLLPPALADALSPFIPGQRLQQMTQPRPEVHAQNNGLQPKTSLNGRISDAAV